MNNTVITGNLGSKPRLFNAGTDAERVNFSIGVNQGRGENRSVAWMDVTLFGPQATNVAESIVVGQELHIQGRLTCRGTVPEKGPEGQEYTRYLWQIEAARFEGVTFGRLPRGGGQATPNGTTTPAQAEQAAATAAASEEVPF